MKFLTQFLEFRSNDFFKDKHFLVTSVEELLDFETKKHLGTKVTAAIVKDDTAYKQKTGEVKTNLFEKVVFKVTKDVDVKVNTYVYPVNPVCKVYGQYNDQLSITASDIRVMQSGKA